MEINKYNIDNFERFLREKTDEFRMYPSKKVWYSIYNNMHPGNRFPSVSMSIILIGFLFLVGYLNTNTVNKNITTGQEIELTTANMQQQFIQADELLTQRSTNTVVKASLPKEKEAIVPTSSKRSGKRFVSKRNGTAILTIQNGTVETVEINNIAATTLSNNKPPVEMNKTTGYNTASAILNNDEEIETTASSAEEKNILTVNTSAPVPRVLVLVNENNPTANTTVKTNSVTAANKKTTVSQQDIAWMEDYGIHNRPAAKKWAGKVSLQAYITPSIVYRTLRSNIPDKVITTNNQSISNQNVGDFLTNKPSFGIETGASLQYDVTKRFKLKAGVQLNYTRYNAHAYKTIQSVSTSITLSNNDGISAYESFRTSDYANSYGINPTKLHNETYQFSIPMGADIKIASLDNLSWYAGATIQPTVILYGKSYIISSDRRNYIQDQSLLNRFNLNAGFETYISYKTNSGYTWQLGPQYRAQLFTTNAKMYSVEERLQNFGFKIGVTKRL